MKKLKLLPIIIMLVAGLITCMIAIVKKFDNTYALVSLFIVLMTFYIIGLIARFVINKVCFTEQVENVPEEGEEGAAIEDETVQEEE